MDISKFLRDNIRRMEAYSTARDEYEGELGIYMDANENPYDNGMNRYPDPHNKKIRERIAEMRGVKPSQVFVGGNGSDEAIDLLIRLFCEPNSDNMVTITPSYGMYRVAAATNAVEVKEVLLDKNFGITADRFLAAADENSKLAILCSPNNPSGNLLDNAEVEKIIERFPGIVVIDEAYIDFAPSKGFLPRFGDFPRLVVMQTLSKAWGMAAVRIGFAFAGEEIVAAMQKIKYPYTVNVITEKVVLKELADKGLRDEQVAEITAERNQLIESLPGIPVVRKVFPSDANFLLVRFDEPRRVYDLLIEKGIIVRDRSRMPRCEGCLRITVGTPAQNKILTETLRSL